MTKKKLVKARSGKMPTPKMDKDGEGNEQKD